MSKTVEDIGTLKINLLSQAQYDAEKAGGRLADDELYLTPSSGGGGGASAFIAEYGVTTYADVKDAYDEDAIILCTVDDSGNTAICQLAYYDDANDLFYFAQPQSDGFYLAIIASDDTWDDSYFHFASTDTATQLRDGLMSALDWQKLDGIESGAEVNVQSDWNQSTNTADDYIKNKPTIPTITDTYSGTSSNGMSGKAVKSAIDALDGTISGSAGAGKTLTAFSQTDGKVSATFSNISITKSQVSDFPTIPTVNDATLTIQKNGTTVNTFTANASSNVTANISVPTNTSDLNNDSGFITDDGIMVVRFTYDEEEDEWSIDKTAKQIYEASASGKDVIGLMADERIGEGFASPLSLIDAEMVEVNGVNEYQVVFSSVPQAFTQSGDDLQILQTHYDCYNDGTINKFYNTVSIPSQTSTPTSNKISEFDSTAHMNSTDMTSQEVSDFVGNLGYSFNLIDMFYPVGSYYETSDTSFDPNITWGGTWVLETEGMVHIGGSPSGTYQVSGATTDTKDGGDATHKHTTGDFTLGTTHIPAHTHGSKTLTGTITDRKFSSNAQNAWPTGIISRTAGTGGSGSSYGTTGTSYTFDTYTINATHEHTSVGGGSAHNHGDTQTVSTMQPYIIVNRWHRTA